jgi:hypothetical protein
LENAACCLAFRESRACDTCPNARFYRDGAISNERNRRDSLTLLTRESDDAAARLETKCSAVSGLAREFQAGE